jgi:excisionase family DNA binding protein
MRKTPTRDEVLAAKRSMDLARAAAYLDVSVKTLRRRIADGTLRAYRVGPRAIRVTLEDLEALKTPIGAA